MFDRGRMLNVRMTDLEMAMIRDVAEAFGLSQSDAIRQLVRRAHAKLDAAELAKRPKPKRK